mgnify:CR=1 FL=1
MLLENLSLKEFLFLKPFHHAIETKDIEIVKFINDHYQKLYIKNKPRTL